MKRALVFVAVLGLALTSPGRADIYTIDGSLFDWGVTPFVDWEPNPPADFWETNNLNEYHASAYEEDYDVEAMYFDNDADNFYFAVVSSYGANGLIGKSDLGLDLNGDMTISYHGVVTGLEYAVHLQGADAGQVVFNPTWLDTKLLDGGYWPGEGWQGSPYEATGGTQVGEAVVAIKEYLNAEEGVGADSDMYIIEVAVPRNIFPDNGGGNGDFVGVHFTVWCGNDSINLFGDIDDPPDPPDPPVPLPGAVILGSLGILSSLGCCRLGRLRGHRTLT